MNPYIFLVLITILTSTCIHACSVERILAEMSYQERTEFQNKLFIAYSFYKSGIGTDDEQVDDIFNSLLKHGVQTSKIAWHPDIMNVWLKEIEHIEKRATK